MTADRWQSNAGRIATPGTQTEELRFDDDSAAPPETLLDLLGDEYTRRVLRAVRDQPRSGAAVARETSISKATAFRRLNALVDLGLVTVTQHVDVENGHHHKQFRAVLADLAISFDPDGLEAVVEVESGQRDHGPGRARVPAND